MKYCTYLGFSFNNINLLCNFIFIQFIIFPDTRRRRWRVLLFTSHSRDACSKEP